MTIVRVPRPAPRVALAWIALVTLGSLPSTATTGPWVTNEQARVRLVAARPHTEAPAEAVAALDLGLEFELESGWHVYWKNSGDAGYPPRLDLSPTPALAKATLLFPAPRRFELPGGLVSFGYEDHVLFPIAPRLEIPADSITARLDYLVCREECIPYTAELSVDAAAARRRSGPEGVATAARLAAVRKALPADPRTVEGAPQVSLHVEPGTRATPPTLVVEVATSGGAFRAAAPDLFFEVHTLFALAKPEFQASRTGLRYRVGLQPLDQSKPLPPTTAFAWTLTGFERAGTSGPVPMAFAGTAPVELPH
jgi:suppressor for copper-sensitivity B